MVLTKELIFKRLSGAKIQQENVEGLAAWILHHVKNISTISRIWFDVYVGADDGLRITLVYVLNDVLQKSRKMTGDLPNKIATCFFYHLRYAILISSDPVKAKIRRVAGILSNRNVISSSREEELYNLLDGKIFRVFPIELNLNNCLDVAPQYGASVQDFDKYRDIINNLIAEEGILQYNYEPSTKKPRINQDEMLNAVDNGKQLMDSVVMAGNMLKTYAKQQAVEEAKSEDNKGPYTDESLDLVITKKENYMIKTNVPVFSDSEFQPSMAKKLRSLEIQQLKNELKPKKEEKNPYTSEIYIPQDTSESQHYSPTFGDDATSSEPYNVYESQSTNSQEFLDSIPMPVALNEIPLPNYEPYVPLSVSSDDAPPGVDDPSKDMSIVMPPPMPSDALQMYSPTLPSGYQMNFSPTKPQSYSPTGYQPGNVSSRKSSSSSHSSRDGRHDSYSRKSYDYRKEQRSRY